MVYGNVTDFKIISGGGFIVDLNFKDIIYEKKDGVAKIKINRPEKLNACTNYSLQEIALAIQDAGWDKKIGVVVITGAGPKAFCTGGDTGTRSKEGYAVMDEGLGFSEISLLDIHSHILHLIRTIPKPVIAAVNGYAVGGGHVLHVVCDISIASETAKFGQVGPKVGSFDAGIGTVYLAHVVGEKKAREIWYMCRLYTAQEALEMGLVNKVVPADKLEEEVATWCKELLEKSPTSLAVLKYSFNTDTDCYNTHMMGMRACDLYFGTDEAMEGRNAFMEKRKPDFNKFRK